MFRLALFFLSVFCLVYTHVYALNYVDCNVLVSDIKDAPGGTVFVHADFKYTQLQYDFSTPSLSSSNLTIYVKPQDSKHSPSWQLDVDLNGVRVVNDQHALVFYVDGFDLSCDARNHLVYTLHDYYERFALVNGRNTSVAEEACSFGYEVFIYNPPCPTLL